MNISLITRYTYSINKNILNKSEQQNTTNPNFKHHPEFIQLQKEGAEILASNYFRRGGFYGSASEKFIDVVNALRQVFHPGLISFFKNYKVKMLIGGVGESQEPFSLLATAKNIMGKYKISDYLDTYTVDLQSKIDKDTVFKQSFYDAYEPEFVKSSFIADDGTKYGLKRYKTHRVTDDIFEYLSDTYNNPEKAKWETRIQDALKEYPDNEFEIASINNTLIYIKDRDELTEAVKNIYRILRRDGMFISDNRLKIYNEIFTPENSVEIYPGIFQKL